MASYYADDLLNDTNDTQAELPDGRWVAARPVQMYGLRSTLRRFRHAWNVLLGRADVLYWHGQ